MTTRRNREDNARLRIHAPASFAGLKHVFDSYQRFVDRHCVPDAVRNDMYIAIEELVSNVIRHGARPSIRPRIVVDLVFLPHVFRAAIVDNGVAFNPLTLPPPDVTLPLDQRPLGGLGILFVTRLMSSVRYRRSNEHNHLLLLRNVETTVDSVAS